MTFEIIQSNSGMWHIWLGDQWMKCTMWKWSAKLWCRLYVSQERIFTTPVANKRFKYEVK